MSKARRRRTAVINVNRHVIKANKERQENNPPLSVKAGKKNNYGRCVIVRDDNGEEVLRLVYRPESPLKCGATVWAYTRLNVEAYEHEPAP